MEAVLEQENEQAVEETEVKVDALQEVLNRMNERDLQESEVVEDAEQAGEVEAEEETPEAPAEPAKVEGPSVAMKTLAAQYGVDEDLLSLARNDEQVRLLIEKTAASREPEPEPEPVEELKLKIEWPEGEFDADDPVRKNITAIHEHYAKKFDEVYGYMNNLAGVALESKKTIEERSQAEQAAVENEFDEFMDSLEAPSLGSRAKGEVSDLAQGFRYAMFQKFDNERKSNPSASRREILERVAKEAGFPSKSQVKQEAIKASASQVLGGSRGNGPPAPPKKLSHEEQFRQRLAEINARPHNKET